MREFLMKDSIFTFIYGFLYNLCILGPILGLVLLPGALLKVAVFLISFVLALVIIHHFPQQKFDRKFLSVLYSGCLSLKIFIMSCLLMFVGLIFFFLYNSVFWPHLVAGILWFFLLENLLFWNGMIRVFLSSVQLGLMLRVVAVLCGWIPIVNIVLLLKIIDVVEKELVFEYRKDLLVDVTVESQQCRTKYPILLVHGIFFRDIKYLNYWGRVPRFLKQQGAVIYYGNQESAQSVAYCGEQLAKRIKQVIDETGCEKVNIVARSKGGLDSRYAVANGGVSQYVASLTTINTPHNGCIFANYLLKKAPKSLVRQVEKMYNTAFLKLGDQQPDFLTAVSDLCDEACRELNQLMPNQPEVYYQGVTSYVNKASGGKFPLNAFYPIVKHFDGQNDGLVSVESTSYFDDTLVIAPPGNRGISHADMIDLNRENIDGFDVREFYKELLMGLKERGL